MNQQNFAVEMSHVSKSFGGICAVHDASIKIKKGTIHALMGENGAGKSTLMKMLCGIINIDEGTVLLNGEEVVIRSLIEAQAHKLAIVPQELALVDYFTVAENLYMGKEPARLGFIDKRKMYANAQKQLDELKIDLNAKTLVKELSVSQQQMLVIAKVLAQDAEIIILDEPTARLGAQEIQAFLEYLKHLRSIGKTLILISHKLEEIFAVCDEVTVLRDGEVVATHNIADITEADLIREMVNRSAEKLTIEKLNDPTDEIILKAEHLCHPPMVKDASFELRKCEILGFYGLVGAGRTETLRSLLGIDKLTSGEVWFKGQKVSFKNIRESMDAGIVLIPEERRKQGLVMNMSIRNNATLTTLDNYCKAGFLQQSKEIRDAEKLREELTIACSSVEQLASNLSGGNQQKVVLSKFVDMPVDVFVFDEPTRGIDVGAKSEIYALIEKLAEQGKSIIIISSEIPELQSICDRVAIMQEGEVKKILIPDEFNDAETMLKYSIGG